MVGVLGMDSRPARKLLLDGFFSIDCGCVARLAILGGGPNLNGTELVGVYKEFGGSTGSSGISSWEWPGSEASC